MQASVLGNRSLVSSVFAALTGAGLELGINGAERNFTYHRAGGSSEFAASYEGAAPEHQAIEIYPGDIEDEDAAFEARATVIFYAESPEDTEALKGIVYECFDKGQLLLLVVPRDLLGETRSLVDLRLR